MRRREFISLLSGATAWSVAARAQRATIPVVGFLRSVPFAGAAPLVDAFRQGLKEAGFVEGQNVALEFRSAEGHLDRLPGLVADLVRRPVNVLNCNNAAAHVAKAATATIPIIFSTGSDPVKDGLVASLNRPGGNLTGASFISGGLGGKRLELLSQLVSKSAVIAMLVNPASAEARGERQDVEAAAQALGKKVIVVEVDSDADVDNAFATFHQRGVGAVLVGAGGFMFSRREQLIALVSRH